LINNIVNVYNNIDSEVINCVCIRTVAVSIPSLPQIFSSRHRSYIAETKRRDQNLHHTHALS